MVSFLIAFGFTCLQDSGVATRSVIATLCGIILILTVWCIWTSWKSQDPSDAEKPKRTILTFEEGHAKQKGFKFRRADSDDSDTTKSKPTKLPSLESLKTTLKAPFKKFRRGNSKKAAEEPIEDMEMYSLKSKQSNI